VSVRLNPSHASRRLRIPGRAVLDNLGARLVAVVALGIGTILVARVGGAEDVGVLALLRVLPGLVGVLAACGLPGAMGYFLAGPHAGHPRLWPTILVLLGAGMGIGTAVWLLLVPVIHAVLLPTASTLVMLLAGVSVATQLPLAVAKSSLQGLDDRKGSNAVTAGEEAAFLPAFGVAWLLGLRGSLLLVVVLIVADVVVAGAGWARLVRQVHGRGMRMTGRPDRPLARSIVSFGLLGQVGGLVNLLNLRLDFLVLGSIAGPAPLGVYAVASKFAELVRLPSLAVTWVSYPRIARLGPEASATVVRRQLPWLGGVGIVGAVVLALAAGPLLPALYGQEFVASVVPAAIIAVGLCASPAGGLAGGYLLGTRRPGTGSVLQAVGLLATLGLDLALIPSFGVTGAAVASAVAYLVTDVSTVLVVRRLTAGTPR
jgi:O-antigen/teichoic acid export membrane protein